MKKHFLISATFVLSSMYVFAQDIILKQDGSEIKVKVLEITDQQVKYKDYDFQSGPTRNINVSDVFMITYENGQKEVFKKQTPTYETDPETHGRAYNTPSSDLKSEFDRIGTNDREMLSFFRRNNFTEQYHSFESACRMRNTGKSLLGTGSGLMLGGVIWIVFGFSDMNLYWMSIAGYAFIGVGNVFAIVSIPISAVAGSKKKVIKNDFTRKTFGVDGYTYQPSLDFGITQSGGVGFTLKF